MSLYLLSLRIVQIALFFRYNKIFTILIYFLTSFICDCKNTSPVRGYTRLSPRRNLPSRLHLKLLSEQYLREKWRERSTRARPILLSLFFFSPKSNARQSLAKEERGASIRPEVRAALPGCGGCAAAAGARRDERDHRDPPAVGRAFPAWNWRGKKRDRGKKKWKGKPNPSGSKGLSAIWTKRVGCVAGGVALRPTGQAFRFWAKAATGARG